MKIKNPETMAEYRKRRNRQWLATGIVVLIALSSMLRSAGKFDLFGLSENVATGILFAVVLGVVIFSLSNWRCPECNKYLGKTFNPGFCSRCGVQLHD